MITDRTGLHSVLEQFFLFWETARHTHSSGNHAWIIYTALITILSSLCLRTVFKKIEEWNRVHPLFFFFFSCSVAQKQPKIQTHCRKWSWIILIIKMGFLINFLNSSSRVSGVKAVFIKGILEITTRYWYQTRPLTWLNMLRPKGKTLHCFCDNNLWPMGKDH